MTIRDIKYFFKEKFIWPYQRVKHGYSDSDKWNWGMHIIEISLPVLKWYREHGSGSPACLSKVNYETGKSDNKGHKKWNKILSEIIEGFELWEKYDGENSISYPKDYFESGQYEKDRKKIDRACFLFGKWMLDIWD